MSEVNIKDVARKAGVSISTVSRVMNSSKNVSMELRERVENAISELGYTTNTIARGLKASQTKEIAVVITDLGRIFYSKVLEGISREANQAGYQIIVMETHDSLDKEIEIVQRIASRWMDGIILVSSVSAAEEKTKEYIKQLGKLKKKGKNIPVVTLEFALDHPNIHAVVIDHKKAAYDAVTHLIHDAGRRNIIHIALPKQYYIFEERLKGYVQALIDNDILVVEENILQGNHTTYSGYQVIKQILEQGKKFDGIFCANDQMAVGALRACEDFGLKVPQDVAIIGYDDIFVTSLVKPALSSVHVPRGRMGICAMRRLIGLIETEEVFNQRIITLETEVIARESTGCQTYDHMGWAELHW